MYDMLTDTEMEHLTARVYRAAVKFLDKVTAAHLDMASMIPWGDAYAARAAAAAVLTAAAAEQRDMHTELIRVLRERREDRAALNARIDAALAEGLSAAQMDAFQADTDADRRDDPMMRDA